MLSGYEALSRRFARSFPVMPRRSEGETEPTAHAPEVPVPTVGSSASDREHPLSSAGEPRTPSDGRRGPPPTSRLIVPAAPGAVAGLYLDVAAEARREFERPACLPSPRP